MMVRGQVCGAKVAIAQETAFVAHTTSIAARNIAKVKRHLLKRRHSGELTSLCFVRGRFCVAF